MNLTAARRILADPNRPGSLADRTRTQRRERLLAAFPDLASMRVLDLGGTAGFWRHLGIVPDDLTIVNLTHPQTSEFRVVLGDACDPSTAVYDETYDLVMCNSVIDQVGGLERRQRLAELIRAVAPSYWVQTANRGFLLDAYFLFPAFAQFPVSVRVAILMRWRLTHMHTTDPAVARERVLGIELQDSEDLRALFPDARVVAERFCGMKKSLLAVRRGAFSLGAAECARPVISPILADVPRDS